MWSLGVKYVVYGISIGAQILCAVFVAMVLAPQSSLAGNVIKLSPYHTVVNRDDKTCFDAQRLHTEFKSDLGYYTSEQYEDKLRRFKNDTPSGEKNRLKQFEDGPQGLRAHYNHQRDEYGSFDSMVKFLAGMLNPIKPERIWTHFVAYYEFETEAKHGEPVARPMVYGKPIKVPDRLTSSAAADICVQFINKFVDGRGRTAKGLSGGCRNYKLAHGGSNNYNSRSSLQMASASLLPNGKSNFGFSFKAAAMRHPACLGDPKLYKVAKGKCEAAMVPCSSAQQ